VGLLGSIKLPTRELIIVLNDAHSYEINTEGENNKRPNNNNNNKNKNAVVTELEG
jgi:hypothetical protein